MHASASFAGILVGDFLSGSDNRISDGPFPRLVAVGRRDNNHCHPNRDQTLEVPVCDDCVAVPRQNPLVGLTAPPITDSDPASPASTIRRTLGPCRGPLVVARADPTVRDARSATRWSSGAAIDHFWAADQGGLAMARASHHIGALLVDGRREHGRKSDRNERTRAHGPDACGARR